MEGFVIHISVQVIAEILKVNVFNFSINGLSVLLSSIKKSTTKCFKMNIFKKYSLSLETLHD